MAWSPDGRVLATGDMDGAIWLWEPTTGAALGSCVGHKKWITSLVGAPGCMTLSLGAWHTPDPPRSDWRAPA